MRVCGRGWESEIVDVIDCALQHMHIRSSDCVFANAINEICGISDQYSIFSPLPMTFRRTQPSTSMFTRPQPHPASLLATQNTYGSPASFSSAFFTAANDSSCTSLDSPLASTLNTSTSSFCGVSKLSN